MLQLCSQAVCMCPACLPAVEYVVNKDNAAGGGGGFGDRFDGPPPRRFDDRGPPRWESGRVLCFGSGRVGGKAVVMLAPWGAG